MALFNALSGKTSPMELLSLQMAFYGTNTSSQKKCEVIESVVLQVFKQFSALEKVAQLLSVVWSKLLALNIGV